MFRKILSTVAMAVICAGCVTYGTIEPVLSSGQQLIYTSGQATIVSEKQNTVTIAPSSSTIVSGGIAEFTVAAANNSPYSWTFGPKIINANLKGNEEPSSNLHVYSYEELIAAELRRQRSQQLSIALGGMIQSLNAQNAAYSQTYGTWSGPYGSGSYWAETYDPFKAQLLQNQIARQTASQSQAASYQGSTILDSLNKRLLITNTLDPRLGIGGIVKIRMPRLSNDPQTISVEVTAGDEVHNFLFRLTKR